MHDPAQCSSVPSTPPQPVQQLGDGRGKPGLAVRQVTKVKLAQKQREGIAEARSGRRSPVRRPHGTSNTLPGPIRLKDRHTVAYA